MEHGLEKAHCLHFSLDFRIRLVFALGRRLVKDAPVCQTITEL